MYTQSRLLIGAIGLISLWGCSPRIASITLCNPSGSPFGGGSGTSSSPYLICSATQLSNIQNYPTSAFALTSSIDISSVGSIFLPNFTGTFNTGGNSITGGVFIYPGSTQPIYLYTSSFSNSVNQDLYSIIGGSLSALTPSSVASSGQSLGISISPNLKWLYTADQNANAGVSEFSINSNTCALTSIGSLLMSDPQNIWVHPNSKWVYASSWTVGIYQYTIDQTTGDLPPGFAQKRMVKLRVSFRS